MRVSDERLAELLALGGDVWAVWRAVEPEEIVALVRELQERRAAERVIRLLDRWEADDTGYDERAQAALDAASDDALRIVDDAVESDATGGDTWEPTQGDIGGTTCAPETTWGWEEIMRKRADTWKKLAAMDAGEAELDAMVVEREDALLGQAAPHKPPKWARRAKRLRDEVRTLFGAVGDLTTSKYELGDGLIALTERVAALEQWRGSLADEQNDGCAEEEWSRQMDEMRAVLKPPRRDCFAIRSQLWECDVVVGGVWRTFYGAVPQAAVAAAWKVWKEARDA